MTTILVTGATTPVGKRLVRALLEEPRVTGVLAAGVEQHSDELESLDPRRVLYLCADLTRSRELRGLLFGPAKQRGVDTIVHLAFHRSAAQRGSAARRLHV